jgi:hypothetical protein
MRSERVGSIITGLIALTLAVIVWRWGERKGDTEGSNRSTALILGSISVIFFLIATPTELGSFLSRKSDQLEAVNEDYENFRDVIGSTYFVVVYSIVFLVFVTHSIITRDWDELQGWLMLTGLIVASLLILTAYAAATRQLDDVINIYKDVLGALL